MEWKDVDWQILRTLRDRFLNPAPGDYWRTLSDLEHYDISFARRIASKWDAVWEENLPVLPASFSVWDWGCGTGVATETLAAENGTYLLAVRIPGIPAEDCRHVLSLIRDCEK